MYLIDTIGNCMRPHQRDRAEHLPLIMLNTAITVLWYGTHGFPYKMHTRLLSYPYWEWQICFELLVIHLLSIICHFWLHRLVLNSCMGLSMQTVRSVSWRFEADFGSLNMGKMATECAYWTGSCVYRIIAPLLLWKLPIDLYYSWPDEEKKQLQSQYIELELEQVHQFAPCRLLLSNDKMKCY